jgi:hypothetical protein
VRLRRPQQAQRRDPERENSLSTVERFVKVIAVNPANCAWQPVLRRQPSVVTSDPDEKVGPEHPGDAQFLALLTPQFRRLVPVLYRSGHMAEVVPELALALQNADPEGSVDVHHIRLAEHPFD